MVVGQAKKKGVRSSKKTAESSASGGETSAETSDSDWIRTNDLLLRRQLLYPAELPNRWAQRYKIFFLHFKDIGLNIRILSKISSHEEIPSIFCLPANFRHFIGTTLFLCNWRKNKSHIPWSGRQQHQ